MKKWFLFTILCGWLFNLPIYPQSTYDRYFTDNALRVDYYHFGNKYEDYATLDQLYEISPWAGSRQNLLDTLNLGDYMVQVFDVQSNRLIFSRGFSSLFREWQTTEEANSGVQKTIHETLIIPFPRKEIRLQLLKRDSLNSMSQIFWETTINPDSWKINREERAIGVEVTTLTLHGQPAESIDLALIAEGYSDQEKAKFLSDCKRMIDHLFQYQPFTRYRNMFNIYALFKPSAQSGTDDPARGVFKNTILNTSFNTFGSQRYVMTFDTRTLHDMASAVPYDALCILVNEHQYGGGGIYNFYATTTVDDPWSPFVFVHEFGHSFAGLGDEYYTSQVAYTDFHHKGEEPWQPNISAHPSGEGLKWKHLVDPDIPLPTPWHQEVYDSLVENWYRLRKDLTQKGASEETVYQAELAHVNQLKQFFNSLPYGNKVGAFEGAGYQGKGLYRPAVNCIMFSKAAEKFDPVCQKAIEKVIRFLTK
ncbi:MAG: peptidase M64 [Calditrichaeota bacterium]|nr:MAG: peptidase M64 [Calditrichota bacterium]